MNQVKFRGTKKGIIYITKNIRKRKVVAYIEKGGEKDTNWILNY